MKVRNYSRGCDQTCPVCARQFWAWMKSRMNQMDRPRKGDVVSFAAAAATSVRPG